MLHDVELSAFVSISSSREARRCNGVGIRLVLLFAPAFILQGQDEALLALPKALSNVTEVPQRSLTHYFSAWRTRCEPDHNLTMIGRVENESSGQAVLVLSVAINLSLM